MRRPVAFEAKCRPGPDANKSANLNLEFREDSMQDLLVEGRLIAKACRRFTQYSSEIN